MIFVIFQRLRDRPHVRDVPRLLPELDSRQASLQGWWNLIEEMTNASNFLMNLYL